MRNFEFLGINNFIINTQYLPLFQKNKLLSINSLLNLKDPIFYRQKRYRIIKGYNLEGIKFYIKQYLANLKEAENEWENITFLWQRGFPTSVPIFFIKNKKTAFIGTEKIRGMRVTELFKKEPKKIPYILTKIAKYLGKFHKEGFIHQDCYLNHFFYEAKTETLYLIDVSRVKYKPRIFFYYQIKDLSQLRYSFFIYLPNETEKWWSFFIKTYEEERNQRLNKFLKILILLKTYLIKRHTEKYFFKK